MDLKTEQALVEAARKDPEAFGTLFEEYYPKIFGYTLKRVGIIQPAEDITAEVFFKAQKKLWQFRWQGIPFSAWLYRITINEINYYFRYGVRHASLSLEKLLEIDTIQFCDPQDLVQELEQAEEQLARHGEFLKIQKQIASMPDKYQQALTLRFFQNKTIAEIAIIMGKKEGTVKSLLSRGLDRLRAELVNSATQPINPSGIVDNERSL